MDFKSDAPKIFSGKNRKKLTEQKRKIIKDKYPENNLFLIAPDKIKSAVKNQT